MNKGKKIPFDRNKPYNQLPDLPPSEEVFNKEVLNKWGLASRKLAELNKNVLRLPNPDMLINTISLQEAKSSSAIENIFTTDDELYKAISETGREEAVNANTKEVLRYREALWTGYHDIIGNGQLSLETIIKTFQQIKDTVNEIRPQQSMTVIRRGNSEFRSGEIVYTPPRGKGIIETKLNNLLDYLNDHKKYPTDPLLKMAVGHYQFEAIHPFSDGNGRTGRIMNLLYLTQTNLLSHPILYLSKYIIENKDDYYYNLNAVTLRGDWNRWLLYMLDAVLHTASHTNALIDDIIVQMAATLEYAKEHLKWYNKDVNELLFGQPYIKSSVIGNLMDRTSRTTITKYMAELVELQILSPKKEGNEVFYLNNDLIRILEG